MPVKVKSGLRLRSAVCETQIVVIRAQDSEMDLRCGGRPMLPLDAARPEPPAPEPGYDTPTLMGKRYGDGAESIEVLCTNGGTSALSLGVELLAVKGPRPLPASD
jgi:hypothetical protein